VDGAAAGLTLNCQRCGGPTTVPHPTAVHGPASLPQGSIEERLAELRRHLKENESQRTEINGYINQLSIQLHRWQIRLQTLDARNKELTDEVVKCVTSGSSHHQP
jgi:rRNA maturation protein Nop10